MTVSVKISAYYVFITQIRVMLPTGQVKTELS